MPRWAMPTSSEKNTRTPSTPIRHAVQLDRDNLDAIRGLAENLMNDGQLDAALEQYKVIADSNPEDAQTYIRMAEIYRRQGKYDEALENLKQAPTPWCRIPWTFPTAWPRFIRRRAVTTMLSSCCRIW
jgi:cytochrome c-type biogenesis protein CcmH/NrfG